VYRTKINQTELKILELMLQRKISETEIARELNLSLSWISECVHHLVDIGFVRIEKKGISRFSQICNDALGESLKRLMIENRMLNLNAILPDSGLLILPLLLDPGSDLKEISERTDLTRRMIRNKLSDWKSMGLIGLERYPDILMLTERETHLSQFLIEFCRARNRSYLSKKHPSGVVVWEWRDEFIFSIDKKIEDDGFQKAGVTGLEDFDDVLFHSSEYYYFCPGKDSLSIEEILIQAIRLDPLNPRMTRMMKRQLENGNIDEKILIMHAKKYDVSHKLKARL